MKKKPEAVRYNGESGFYDYEDDELKDYVKALTNAVLSDSFTEGAKLLNSDILDQLSLDTNTDDPNSRKEVYDLLVGSIKERLAFELNYKGEEVQESDGGGFRRLSPVLLSNLSRGILDSALSAKNPAKYKPTISVFSSSHDDESFSITCTSREAQIITSGDGYHHSSSNSPHFTRIEIKYSSLRDKSKGPILFRCGSEIYKLKYERQISDKKDSFSSRV